jgi:hypothetical protein
MGAIHDRIYEFFHSNSRMFDHIDHRQQLLMSRA